MENNQDYYVTYRFFDERGRRLAIFGVPVDKAITFGQQPLGETPTHIKVTVITCSKKDTFSKRIAKEMFDNTRHLDKFGNSPEAHPLTLIIPMEENKPKWSFLNWCQNTYYKQYPLVFGVEAIALFRNNEMLDGSIEIVGNILAVFPEDNDVNQIEASLS